MRLNLRNKFVDLTLKTTVVVTAFMVGVHTFYTEGTTSPNPIVAHQTDEEAIQKAENLIAEVNSTQVLEDALNKDRTVESKKYGAEWIVKDENTIQLSINFRAVTRIDGLNPVLYPEYAAAVAGDVSYVLDEMNDRFHGGQAKTHEITLQILNETGDVMYERGNGIR